MIGVYKATVQYMINDGIWGRPDEVYVVSVSAADAIATLNDVYIPARYRLLSIELVSGENILVSQEFRK